MVKESLNKTITEPAREIDVCREVDVVVVGGGPGGVAAAITAARNGARTVIVERYGYLGGMATGGLVNIFPNLSDISGKQHIAGFCQEVIDRLEARNGASYPEKEHWGTSDKQVVDYYHNAGLGWFYIRQDLNMGKEKRVLYSALVDPEIMKDDLNDMAAEAGVDLLLHSWGTRPVMEGDTVKGIFFESKSGRQAILAKVVIDSTGDGDIFIASGAEYDSNLDPKLRLAKAALVAWFVNVDIKKYSDFKADQPEKNTGLMRELMDKGGLPRPMIGLLNNQEGVVWYHNMIQCPDQKDVEELTSVDIKARKKILTTYEFMKKFVPGFEKSFIMLTAPQIGTQGGSRVIGEYILTPRDMESDEVFEDTIAILANNDNGEISAKHPAICIPYRCLVPRRIEGLLVACRAFSSEDKVNAYFNIIPPCMCFGQAAGTAAAMAVKEGIQPRYVDYKALHDNLVKQNVILPDI